MRHLIRYILFFPLYFLSLSLFAQEAPVQDSTSSAMDKETVQLIMKMFDGQEISMIKVKADQLISSGKDSAEQALIASYIFD